MNNDFQIIRRIFHDDLEKDLLEHIKDKFKATDADVTLLNRRDRQFYHLQDARDVLVTNEKLKQYLHECYFKRKSHVYVNDEGNSTGLALISTSIGILGYIVVENMYTVGSVQIDEHSNNGEFKRLDDYGALYGTLVLRRFQDTVKDHIVRNQKTKQDNLHKCINDFIPFGNNSCISVFLDIREFSKLINDKSAAVYMPFIQDFSQNVENIANGHFGIVSSHFGGGMLITFNHFDNEDDESCFRAICTIRNVIDAFEKLVDEHFGSAHKNCIHIGIGASVGNAFFSTFGFNSYNCYTGIGEEVGSAKKVESNSGRENASFQNTITSSKGKVFVSDKIFEACQKFKNHGIEFETFPPFKENKNIHHVKGVDNERCPLSHNKCLNCKSIVNQVKEVVKYE